MRVFFWVVGGLGVAVALAFMLALLRERPVHRVVLPPELRAGERIEGAEADAAFRAWTASLPPAPAPLTTRYAMSVDLAHDADVRRRGEYELGVMNGGHGRLRLELHVRSGEEAEPLETVANGVILLDGGTFWAWGSLPIHPRFEDAARGKVVRLPQEALVVFFREAMRLAEGFGAVGPEGGIPDDALRIADWFHPANVAALLTRSAEVLALAQDGDALHATVSGASSALVLLGRWGASPELEEVARTPLALIFDAHTGELRSAGCELPKGRGSFHIEAVEREASAPASEFRYPDELQIVDLTLLAQVALIGLRQLQPPTPEAAPR